MTWNVVNACACLCQKKVVPAKVVKVCLMCLEPGAAKRICCNANYCDFCYTKNKLCPNCNAATRQEKQTGAVFMITALSEHEECRSCLDPGLKRRCCDNYYCDDCYFNQPLCRVCNAPVGTRVENHMDSSRYIPVIIGWGISFFVVAVAAIGTFLIIVNEPLIPVGIFGYRCYGFFPTCPLDVCIDVAPAVASGEIALNPLSTWQTCSLDSAAKIETAACIYDKALYTETKGLFGYDVCLNSFQKGSFIFEDTFEYWKNASVSSNKMKTGYWGEVVNGRANDYCGTGSGDKALSFAGGEGGTRRYAQTAVLDLSSGGWLEGEVFLSPLGYDFSHPNCKTAYGGSVEILYSTNNGNSWTSLIVLNPLKSRQESFFPIKFFFSPDSSFKATIFKFEQPFFNVIGDGWAIDNVKVFKYFPTNWQTSSSFQKNLIIANNFIQRAQCCFDTEWCETRLSPEQMDNCKISTPFYSGRRYIMRGAEVFVIIAIFINFVKFCYISVQDLLMKKRFPFQDEVEDFAKFDRFFQLLPLRWRPRKKIEDYISDVHMSARMDAEMRDRFADEEGSGELEQTKDDVKLANMKEKKRKRAVKTKQLRILVRLRKANKEDEKGADELRLIAELAESDSDEEDEEEKDVTDMDTKFGTDSLLTDKDKLKRKDNSRLRTPFECQVSQSFRLSTILLCLVPVTIMVLVKISTSSEFTIYQHVQPYGVYDKDIALTSDGLNLLAFICDIKEVWHTLKHVFPARDQWVPAITLDTSEDFKALYIGTHTILLKEIVEFNSYKRRFATAVIAAFVWGCFPWCLFSLILRDSHLPFDASRVSTPILGVISISRALLGPGLFMKFYFCLTYLLGFDFETREKVGRAIQSEKTKYGALNAAVAFSFFGIFLCASLDLDFLKYGFPIALCGGLVYGSATGCYHSLPIKPWMYITKWDDGIWLRVKRKVKCPCRTSCMYCTKLHEFTEMFFIYPNDSMRFFNVVKSASAAADQ